MILERSMSFDEIYVRNVCENLFKDFKIGIAYHIYSSASQSNCITKRSIPSIPNKTPHTSNHVDTTALPTLPYLPRYILMPALRRARNPKGGPA